MEIDLPENKNGFINQKYYYTLNFRGLTIYTLDNALVLELNIDKIPARNFTVLEHYLIGQLNNQSYCVYPFTCIGGQPYEIKFDNSVPSQFIQGPSSQLYILSTDDSTLYLSEKTRLTHLTVLKNYKNIIRVEFSKADPDLLYILYKSKENFILEAKHMKTLDVIWRKEALVDFIVTAQGCEVVTRQHNRLRLGQHDTGINLDAQYQIVPIHGLQGLGIVEYSNNNNTLHLVFENVLYRVALSGNIDKVTQKIFKVDLKNRPLTDVVMYDFYGNRNQPTMSHNQTQNQNTDKSVILSNIRSMFLRNGFLEPYFQQHLEQILRGLPQQDISFYYPDGIFRDSAQQKIESGYRMFKFLMQFYPSNLIEAIKSEPIADVGFQKYYEKYAEHIKNLLKEVASKLIVFKGKPDTQKYTNYYSMAATLKSLCDNILARVCREYGSILQKSESKIQLLLELRDRTASLRAIHAFINDYLQDIALGNLLKGFLRQQRNRMAQALDKYQNNHLFRSNDIRPRSFFQCIPSFENFASIENSHEISEDVFIYRLCECRVFYTKAILIGLAKSQLNMVSLERLSLEHLMRALDCNRQEYEMMASFWDKDLRTCARRLAGYSQVITPDIYSYVANNCLFEDNVCTAIEVLELNPSSLKTHNFELYLDAHLLNDSLSSVYGKILAEPLVERERLFRSLVAKCLTNRMNYELMKICLDAQATEVAIIRGLVKKNGINLNLDEYLTA